VGFVFLDLLVFCVIFCRPLFVLLFYLCHCSVCPSSIYGFWLHRRYIKAFLSTKLSYIIYKYRDMNISYLCEKCFIWTSPCFLLGSVLFIFLVVCVVLLCFFTFLVPCCEDRYALRITTMFGSSLPAVVCRRANVLFTLFVFDCA
jgi:hypothetical protein